jgi:hypothetical protein
MKRSSFLLLSALLLLALPAPAAAQDQGTWFTIFADHVQIHNQKAFEEYSHEFVEMFSEAGVEGVSWVTISGSDVGYVYAVPGMGPADMDEMNASWGAAIESIGQPIYDLMAKSDALVESREMYYLKLRSDLSYMPDDVDLVSAKPFRHYTYLYVKPGAGRQFEAAIAPWQAAYEDAGIESGWRIYEIVSGNDLPAYLVVSSSDTEHHYYMMSEENQEALGEQFMELRAGTGAALRRVEQTSGWVRPDMSYPPMAMEGDTD